MGNILLAYPYKGRNRLFETQCKSYGHEIVMVADESQSRRQRAYYPHRVTVGQLSVTLQLKARLDEDLSGRPIPFSSEYETFMRWIGVYSNVLLNHNQASGFPPFMTVYLRGRRFARNCIPISGMSYGDHLASVLYEPTILFEVISDPYSTKTHVPHSTFYDQVALAIDPDVKYFYPLSDYQQAQQDANEIKKLSSGLPIGGVRTPEQNTNPAQPPAPLPPVQSATTWDN